MKTAISVPDELYAEAERLRRLRGTSRSQLYTEAMREYLARHDPDAITEALNRVYADIDSRMDPAFAGVVRKAFERNEW